MADRGDGFDLRDITHYIRELQDLSNRFASQAQIPRQMIPDPTEVAWVRPHA